MTNQEKLENYPYLLINNARCMGFLHGLSDLLSKQNDQDSLEIAKQIMVFLIELNDNPQFYYDTNFQSRNLATYRNKLVWLNSIKKNTKTDLIYLAKLN